VIKRPRISTAGSAAGAGSSTYAVAQANRSRSRTYPSVMPWLSLDRIYVRGFKVHEVRVPKGIEWSQRSDHMPLIADLEVA
jgi:endonuclease/exonuclease/phosphatase family metal-dependent hydrolase